MVALGLAYQPPACTDGAEVGATQGRNVDGQWQWSLALVVQDVVLEDSVVSLGVAPDRHGWAIVILRIHHFRRQAGSGGGGCLLLLFPPWRLIAHTSAVVLKLALVATTRLGLLNRLRSALRRGDRPAPAAALHL